MCASHAAEKDNWKQKVRQADAQVLNTGLAPASTDAPCSCHACALVPARACGACVRTATAADAAAAAADVIPDY